MASLQAPLTIISDSGSGSGSGNDNDNDNDNDNQPFQPPAATWYDEDPLHFVALEARRNCDGSLADGGRNSVTSEVGSVDISLLASASGPSNAVKEGEDAEHPSEIVTYQAFALPQEHRRGHRSQGDADQSNDEDGSRRDASTSKEQMSAFDAAKKVARESLKTLSTNISVSFPLPLDLATENCAGPSSSSVTVDDDDTFATFATYATTIPSRRIPILAKFSPKMGNMRLLALQYTPTNIRIATVEGGDALGGSPTENKGKNTFTGMGAPAATHTGEDQSAHYDHWTIDLSYAGAQPVVSKPEELPKFRPSGFNRFGKNESRTLSIIGGGILWNARGDQNGTTSLDLVVVTTTSVIIYNINAAKKQLAKTQVFPHDLAASFWYESTTRTLVIGSYKSNQNSNVGNGEERQTPQATYAFDDSFSVFSADDSEAHPHGDSIKSTSFQYPSAVMAMKTLFFSKDSAIVETLPIFAVGTLREVAAQHDEDERHELMLAGETWGSKSEKTHQKGASERAVVLPAEIFLVNLYGSIYCVELGSLGSGQGLGLIKLDKEARCIHVRHIHPPFPKPQKKYGTVLGQKEEISISAGVIDNLLCIFSKRDETTYFLDVVDIFSDDHRVFRECIERFEPEIHDESLSFLAPHFFLDTSGQGLLYQVVLSLPLVLENVPPTACIIPFLLRRNAPRAMVRSHIMERFSSLIWKRDMSTLQKWIGVIVDHYSKSDSAHTFDFEPHVNLLSKSSLIALDGAKDADDIDHIMVPESCRDVVTQREFLQMILLPHAISAIKKDDARKLGFISSLAVHYFVQLERRFMSPSVALQCLVVALLWRTGGNAELSSFLLAQQSQWTIAKRRRQLNLLSAEQIYLDNPELVSFAERLFIIATEEVSDKASVCCAPPTARQLISHATIILLDCGAASLAVKCLLSVGQVNDAISICLKKIGPKKGDVKFSEGTSSKHFFRATVSNAKKQSMSDRYKSFNHLRCFLQQWDPSSFALDSRKVKVLRSRSTEGHRRRTSFKDVDTVVVEQSVFAHDCPRFPDELLGGKKSVFCQKLRTMFGYAHSVK